MRRVYAITETDQYPIGSGFHYKEEEGSVAHFFMAIPLFSKSMYTRLTTSIHNLILSGALLSSLFAKNVFTEVYKMSPHHFEPIFCPDREEKTYKLQSLCVAFTFTPGKDVFIKVSIEKIEYVHLTHNTFPSHTDFTSQFSAFQLVMEWVIAYSKDEKIPKMNLPTYEMGDRESMLFSMMENANNLFNLGLSCFAASHSIPKINENDHSLLGLYTKPKRSPIDFINFYNMVAHFLVMDILCISPEHIHRK